jgi:hypothetical protein
VLVVLLVLMLMLVVLALLVLVMLSGLPLKKAGAITRLWLALRSILVL